MDRSIDIGPPRDDEELRRYGEIAPQALGFPFDLVPAWLERIRTQTLLFLARVDGEVAGGLVVLRFGHWIGGRSVPTGGVSGVAVAPEHRSRGVASALVRHAFGHMSEARLPLSTLYPATNPLYRAAGYDTAGSHVTWRLPTVGLGALPRDLDVTPITKQHVPEMAALYEERARTSAGQVDRSPLMWTRVFEPFGDRTFAYGVRDAGRLVAYAVWTHQMAASGYELVARDLVTSTEASARRLLALVGDHASLGHAVHIVADARDPVLSLSRERTRQVADCFPWMARLVDVRAALSARGYSPVVRGEVHLDVRDAVLPVNARRLVLTVEGGSAEIREGGRGEVVADVRAMASLFTGFATAFDLRGAGLLTGDDAALSTLTALFAGPAPWMADYF